MSFNRARAVWNSRPAIRILAGMSIGNFIASKAAPAVAAAMKNMQNSYGAITEEEVQLQAVMWMLMIKSAMQGAGTVGGAWFAYANPISLSSLSHATSYVASQVSSAASRVYSFFSRGAPAAPAFINPAPEAIHPSSSHESYGSERQPFLAAVMTHG